MGTPACPWPADQVERWPSDVAVHRWQVFTGRAAGIKLPVNRLSEASNTQFPCLTTARLGYLPHARCQNFSYPERGGATHHVWYSLEGGPYSGTRIRGDSDRFPRFRHCEST